jgi:ABC-2 type transport system ATP-binding protein
LAVGKETLEKERVGREGHTYETTDVVGFAGASKSYGGVRAVEGLDLAIGRGETVALLGPNGAGKSTTIGMLLGLLPPDEGTVRLFGGSPRGAVAAGRVGSMLQEAGLPSNVKVAELVAFVRGLYPEPLPVEKILATAGISGLIGRRSDKLSGGQTARVRFALALSGDPDLLVLDEPTAAMDVEGRREFWKSMRSHAATGRTILFSTHYLEEADVNADRIVVIAGGRVVAEGPGTEIKNRAGGRTVSLDLSGGPSGGLDRLPGVVSVEMHGDRATLRSTDSDATVAALVGERGTPRNLEVSGVGLEEAFLALTTQDKTREEN